MFLLVIDLSLMEKWPTSASNTAAIFIQKDSFAGHTDADIGGAVVGPLSNNIYFLYKLTSPFVSVVRRMNSDKLKIIEAVQ